MPEIKHTFQAGKMNKDLDERLVPQGEYRDALNIEVRTSDGNDIGAAQNLYGTLERLSYDKARNPIEPTVNSDGEKSYFVGCISDEKTNNSYFFVASPTVTSIDQTAEPSVRVYKDMIIKYNSDSKKLFPVFTDIFRVEIPASEVVGDIPLNDIGSQYASYDHIVVSSSLSGYVRPGMSINVLNAASMSIIGTDMSAYNTLNGMSESVIVREFDSNTNTIWFDRYVVGNLESAAYFVFTSEKVLRFSQPHSHYISGINIVNNLLLWTDNINEPRKINLDRLKESAFFTRHSDLFIDNPTTTTNSLIQLEYIDKSTDSAYKEEHITLIRRAPRTAPKLIMSQFEGGKGASYSSSCVFNWVLEDGESLPGVDDYVKLDTFNENGDSLNTSCIANGDSFSIGQTLQFTCTTEPLVVTAKVTQVLSSGVHRVQIIKIDDEINSSHLEWDIEIVQKKSIFETTFGRFGYRYKYQDGEYSSFSPWSELAFIPSKFDYLPTKGYNLGMVNTMRSLQITDFIVEDFQRPDDVIAVDILFKDTVSPNVYVVKSIRRGYDEEWNDNAEGSGNSGVVDITTEMIHKTLPSSQTLRAWDNVPITAKAQEVTGNRVVFANYEQNYDTLSKVFVHSTIESTDHPTDLSPIKSIKSLRRYKVGVVFGDKYGRETPVMGIGGKVIGNGGGAYTQALEEVSNDYADQTFPDSIFVPKNVSFKVNKISAELNWDGNPDNWIEYYKYYIKETSNEYYNLVMDRWYPAEDGNIWLSFQSSDRNKVDIETYLTLKNKHGSEDPVEEDARYKILAISNEAPRFIKSTNRIIGLEALSSDSGVDLSNSLGVQCESWDAYDNTFKDYKFEGVGWARIVGTLAGVTRFSKWVRIARLHDANRSITVVGSFGPTADMSGDINFGTSTGLTVSVEVRDSVEENRPEFEGRFFVKVFKDATLTNTILGTNVATSSYKTVSSYKIGYVDSTRSDGKNPASWAKYQGDYAPPSQGDATIADINYSTCATSLNNWGEGNALGDWSNANNAHNIQNGYMLARDDGGEGASNTKGFWKWYWNNNPQGSSKWFIDGSNWNKTNDQPCGEISGPMNAIGNAAPFSVDDGVNHISFSAMRDDTWDEETLAFRDALQQEGTLFRFKSDPGGGVGNGDGQYTGEPTIYVVRGTDIGESGFGLASSNYGGQHSGGNSYCHECYEGANWSNVCKRGTFKLYFSRYDDYTKGLDLDYWDPRSALRHDGTTMTYIEIVQSSYDNTDVLQTSVGNAIWETEPKEDVGLDLYYEATSALPLKLNNSNIQSFAPSNTPVTSERLDAEMTPVNLDYCYVDDAVTATPTVRYAIRDVVGLGQADDVDNVTRYPIAIGDELSFNRLDGSVTRAKVIDYYKPITSYINQEAYTAIENVYVDVDTGFGTIGAMVEEQEVEYPFNPASYEKSSRYTLQCTVANFDGQSTIELLTASLPDDFNSDDGKIWEITSSDLSILKGTFTKTAAGPTPGIDIGSTYTTIYWHNCGYSEQQVLESGSFDITFREVTGYYRLNQNVYNNKTTLPWFNCYSFGNGLESDRIRDDFNAPQIDNGCKVSTGLEDYRRERRSGGLIWSGIYNSTSGVNKLNEFNMAEAITKDLNPLYGSIQALKTRDTNLVTFCEDKVLQILANKDALYNADGSSNVTASNVVLGNAKAFAGDYGISSNPESLAFDAYRMYFTDKQRGKVLRLSQDGLTPISDVGMSSYFRDNLKHADQLIGTFDEVKGEYNLTIKYRDPYLRSNEGLTSTTVSFNEKTKGWPSFKSFVPDTGLSINAEYITAANGSVWSHHNKDVTINSSGFEGLVVPANNFYGEQYNSTIDILFNENPGAIKGFTAMNYEGDQAKITEWGYTGHLALDASGNSLGYVGDNEYYNWHSKDGWFVESFNTDLQESSVLEFINKEGKWFSNINGIPTTLENLDTSEFTVQGIGMVSSISIPQVVGCMDPLAANYNPEATVSSNDCNYDISGCTDPNAFNFNSAATIDDGSCVEVIEGCMDVNAINYNPNANVDDGSCEFQEEVKVGCMDSLANNYDVNATVACADCCTYTAYGCMDPTAQNYDPLAQEDDGTCIPHVDGCTDPIALNWNSEASEGNPFANVCVYNSGCMDPDAWNYDPLADTQEFCEEIHPANWQSAVGVEDACCIPVITGCMDIDAINFNPLANTTGCSDTDQLNQYFWFVEAGQDATPSNIINFANMPSDVFAVYNDDPINFWNNYDPVCRCVFDIEGCTDPDADNYNPDANVDDGSCEYTSWDITITEMGTHSPDDGN
tara:strand:+ start:4913 stop:11743 length:6831 start_codon:yes stop_codon:yes gene_type:complete